MNPTLQLTFTDGLIIGALFIGWIRFEYRWAQRLAEKRQRKADRTTPRVVGQNFDNPNRMEWQWPAS